MAADLANRHVIFRGDFCQNHMQSCSMIYQTRTTIKFAQHTRIQIHKEITVNFSDKPLLPFDIARVSHQTRDVNWMLV